MKNDPERPAHDEWGVYDPEQAGFEAILRKLTPAKKAPKAPEQKPPVQTPTADDGGSVWMTPDSALKRSSK
jgi:hypothetical protein